MRQGLGAVGCLVGWVGCGALLGCLDAQRGRIAATSDADTAGSDTRPGPTSDVNDTAEVGEVSEVADTAEVAVDATVDIGEVAEPGFFEGGWLIEQPLHALYEASYYRFERDGRVELVASTPADCTGHLERFCETGHVSPPNGNLLCRFGGGRWSELSERVLAIDSVCEDGVSRVVVLDFTELDPATWGTPRIVEVDGEEGWVHASWDWTFRRCEADLEFGFEPVRCE